MTNDLGFVFVKLNNSDIYDKYFEVIQNFISNNPLNQIVVFNSYNEKINTKNIPILHISHAKFFYGNLVIFDLASAILTKTFTNINKRYMYINSMPWIDNPNSSYKTWASIYLESDNIELIAPNQQVYDIYDICWKKPIGISENFNYEELKNIIC